ncbi:MAG: asparagine synthase (glutamine-hydrolyzing) [Candidatus Pacebacteria bacterium]|jgi:asparagine synthase (glutamine-hydrolysing)|nr:asparagine synthase (glutamine-hydrolyzing) [bacterium]MDP6527909.1 asparagine synthase (glutamine-hydrolyzing) [Candidatus Paceibacterota bacterium]MDP6659718.1 asparagine synthase (glutamine-hydrolyzing) [Candidatus Paceibacterota bacterium]|tara:strand:- start:8416 stop:10263 length:1848 start_codon:yes stop_codon:yes gene_type:complete
MCGIAGILDLNERPIKKDVLKAMVKAQVHRGPNDEGIYIDNSIGLGHRRLSIIDLSKAGHQPMGSTHKDLHIVTNGEIYNYIELKEELGGEYQSASDTEVLLKAYEKWDENCLSHLNGIFAFAIWDEKKQRLFAARDHMGVKPFYYVIEGGVFYFASEIKALFAAGIKAVPNDRIISDYLKYGFYEHSEETFFESIKQLMPGHYLTSERGEIRVKRYWHLPDNVSDLSSLSDKDVQDRYRELVTKSITRQLRSDVPVGIPASGGLDCSIITGVVNQINEGQKNFQLFSWIYGNPDYDETPFASSLANSLGWDISFFELSPQKALDIIPDVMKAEEQPFPGISIVARHLLYKEADPNLIVLIEGHGGDEIGGGYPYYFGNFISDLVKKESTKEIETEIEAYANLHRLTKEEMDSVLKMGLEAYSSGGVSADASKFSSSNYLNNDFISFVKRDMPKLDLPFKSRLANIQYRDLRYTKEPRVLRSVDRNSMAYGKEVRVPFLDHKIVEFCFSLPPRQKIRNGTQRFFMREAFKDLLPPHILNTPKRAVPDPQRAWLKNELKDWTEDILSSESFKRRPYFNQEEIQKEYNRYCSSTKIENSFHIWQWINLELWFRNFID